MDCFALCHRFRATTLTQAAFLDLSRILMAENSRPNIDRAMLNQGVEIDFY